MVPGRGIVAGPGESVALPTRKRRSRKHERTLIRPQFEQAFVGGTSIFQSHDVVNLGMRRSANGETWFFDPMAIIEGHGLAWSIKDGRLVHIVPETGNAIFDEILVEAA